MTVPSLKVGDYVRWRKTDTWNGWLQTGHLCKIVEVPNSFGSCKMESLEIPGEWCYTNLSGMSAVWEKVENDPKVIVSAWIDKVRGTT